MGASGVTEQDAEFGFELGRRRLLAAAGIGAVASAMAADESLAASVPVGSSEPVATPPVAGLHLQFGADAASEVTVSWHTLHPVQKPRVVVGHLDGRLEQTVSAQPARSGTTDERSR